MKGIFTGAYAVNPFTGERVPVWAANFVLAALLYFAINLSPLHDTAATIGYVKPGSAAAGVGPTQLWLGEPTQS